MHLDQVSFESPDLHRSGSCQRKRRYRTRQTAKHVLREMRRARSARARGLEVYRCQYCDGGFHLGHPNAWEER